MKWIVRVLLCAVCMHDAAAAQDATGYVTYLHPYTIAHVIADNPGPTIAATAVAMFVACAVITGCDHHPYIPETTFAEQALERFQEKIEAQEQQEALNAHNDQHQRSDESGNDRQTARSDDTHAEHAEKHSQQDCTSERHNNQ